MNILKKVTNSLEVPEELIFNIPISIVKSNKEIEIENYKGVIEYGEDKIRISTKSGIIKLTGDKLTLKQIATEKIIIKGIIIKIEFLF